MAAFPPSTEARLATLERQVKWWRVATLGTLAALVLGGATAFRQPGAVGPLEATSLVLRNADGTSVTLSLRPLGDLEARFGQASGGSLPEVRVAGLVLVNAAGREVGRLGEPTMRRLGQ